MSWSWTLNRYLAQQFLACVGIWFAGLLFLSFSIDVVDLFNRTANKQVPSSAVIGMSLLQLPSVGLKLLPFAVLLGGVLDPELASLFCGFSAAAVRRCNVTVSSSPVTLRPCCCWY